MSAKILHQVKINNCLFYSLQGRDFTTDGIAFSIIGSAITGPEPYDVTHTVKNVEKGTYADIPMQKLISILLISE